MVDAVRFAFQICVATSALATHVCINKNKKCSVFLCAIENMPSKYQQLHYAYANIFNIDFQPLRK